MHLLCMHASFDSSLLHCRADQRDQLAARLLEAAYLGIYSVADAKPFGGLLPTMSNLVLLLGSHLNTKPTHAAGEPVSALN